MGLEYRRRVECWVSNGDGRGGGLKGMGESGQDGGGGGGLMERTTHVE